MVAFFAMRPSPRPSTVPSPCVAICELDAEGRVCQACRRTVAEITGWAVADDDSKRAVLARIAAERKSQDMKNGKEKR
ncbi:MAG: DUF1289 domain-containing protein [Planctomycetota bacterium]